MVAQFGPYGDRRAERGRAGKCDLFRVLGRVGRGAGVRSPGAVRGAGVPSGKRQAGDGASYDLRGLSYIAFPLIRSTRAKCAADATAARACAGVVNSNKD